MALISLDKMTIGQSGRLAQVDSTCDTTQRLMVMGLLPGASLKLVRVAPLGDPIAIDLNGCLISLRRREAASLIVDCD